jgi:hypoxanthine phosphoribosyltransferase
MQYKNDKGESYELEEMFPESQIMEAVERLAKEIENRYETAHIVGLLKGSFMFVADLIRILEIPVTVDFMAVSSYIGTESSGEIKILKELNEPIFDRNVIIVEDIVDTGLTLYETLELLHTRDPKRLEVCTLLDKHERREKDIEIGFTGISIPDEFIVGYGIDYEQRHRELRGIHKVAFI